MADLLVVATLVAFFALAVLLVRGCERIIGPDENAAGAPADEPSPAERLAA